MTLPMERKKVIWADQLPAYDQHVVGELIALRLALSTFKPSTSVEINGFTGNLSNGKKLVIKDDGFYLVDDDVCTTLRDQDLVLIVSQLNFGICAVRFHIENIEKIEILREALDMTSKRKMNDEWVRIGRSVDPTCYLTKNGLVSVFEGDELVVANTAKQVTIKTLDNMRFSLEDGRRFIARLRSPIGTV